LRFSKLNFPGEGKLFWKKAFLPPNPLLFKKLQKKFRLLAYFGW